MKKIFLAIGLAFAGLSAQAQTTTNFVWRVQEEHVTASSTNIITTANWKWDSVTKKEKARVDGMIYAFGKYQSGGGQNTLVQWIRTDVNDRGQEYANAKQVVDNAALLSKLQNLLLTNPDLLTNADLNNLNTIAAKAP